jgi:hypothetical protein
MPLNRCGPEPCRAMLLPPGRDDPCVGRRSKPVRRWTTSEGAVWPGRSSERPLRSSPPTELRWLAGPRRLPVHKGRQQRRRRLHSAPDWMPATRRWKLRRPSLRHRLTLEYRPVWRLAAIRACALEEGAAGVADGAETDDGGGQHSRPTADPVRSPRMDCAIVRLPLAATWGRSTPASGREPKPPCWGCAGRARRLPDNPYVSALSGGGQAGTSASESSAGWQRTTWAPPEFLRRWRPETSVAPAG